MMSVFVLSLYKYFVSPDEPGAASLGLTRIFKAAEMSLANKGFDRKARRRHPQGSLHSKRKVSGQQRDPPLLYALEASGENCQ